MVRRYDPSRQVARELVEKLLAHAVRAPSGGLSQGWGFLVLQEPDDRQRFWSSFWRLDGGPNETEAHRAARQYMDRGWWVTAPLVIIALSEKDRYLNRYAKGDKGWEDRSEARWPAAYWDMDAGAATLMMHLTALNEGLASCYIGLSPESIPEFKQTFSVPDGLHPVVGLTIGYAEEIEPQLDVSARKRPLSEVVRYGRWGDVASEVSGT